MAFYAPIVAVALIVCVAAFILNPSWPVLVLMGVVGATVGAFAGAYSQTRSERPKRQTGR